MERTHHLKEALVITIQKVARHQWWTLIALL